MEKLYAVEPVGVATTTASAVYDTKGCPWTRTATAADLCPGLRSSTTSLSAVSRESPNVAWTPERDSTVNRRSSIASRASGSSGMSTSARKPSRPTLTPSTGTRLPATSRIARSIVPSPPRLISRSAVAAISSAPTATASHPIRATSAVSPRTLASRARLQRTTVATVGALVRSGWSTSPTVPMNPIPDLLDPDRPASLLPASTRTGGDVTGTRAGCPRHAAPGGHGASSAGRPSRPR